MDKLTVIGDAFKYLTTEKAVQEFITLAKKCPQVDCPVYHHFSPGIYIRELNVPSNTVLAGYKQKTEHLNIFLQGAVLIIGNDGHLTEMKAPMIFTSPPGRKIGYVKEFMVWLNVYNTTETDIETLENTYLDKSDAWTEDELRDLNKFKSGVKDREDYARFLRESGLTEEIIRSESETEIIPFPSGMYSVGVFDSPVEGKGLFATANFYKGQYIAPARVKNLKTPAGRFTNHSIKPNAAFVEVNNDIHLIATKNIQGNQGGIIGDEITVDYRESLKYRNKEV